MVGVYHSPYLTTLWPLATPPSPIFEQLALRNGVYYRYEVTRCNMYSAVFSMTTRYH